MSRLGTSQKKIARDYGMSNAGSLSQWLRSTSTHEPAVARAGAKAMQWYEANKSRQPAPQQPLPPYKPADVKQARIHTNLFALHFRIVAKITAVLHKFTVTNTPAHPRMHY